MRIDSLPDTSVTALGREKPSTGRYISAEAANPSPPATTSVSISGEALVRQRLFGSTSSYEPRVFTYHDGLDGVPMYQYLTREDRRLFGEIYELAQAESIDLQYVDQLARDLGDYRSHNDGRIMVPFSQVKRYDPQGHQQFYNFTDVDAAVAKRIRESAALASTRMDKGFVKFETDPDYSALGHTNFVFLEFVVNRLSNANESVPVDPALKQYQFIEKNYVITHSKEVYPHMRAKKNSTSASTAAERHQALLDKNRTAKKTKPAQPQNLSAVLRRIVQQYLQSSGLTTLFDMIARSRR